MKMAAPTPHRSTMEKLMGLVIRDRSSAIGFRERQHAASALQHPLVHSPMLLKMKRHIAKREGNVVDWLLDDARVDATAGLVPRGAAAGEGLRRHLAHTCERPSTTCRGELGSHYLVMR